MQAAIGLGQLNYVKQRTERSKRNYELYKENLGNLEGFSLFKFDIKNGEQPQWTDAIVEKRNELDKYLADKGIGCRRFWFPIHTQAPYKMPDDKFPNSTKLSPRAIWLPSSFTLSDDDVINTCSHIKEFLRKK